jgi:NTP pyrophosphatase (non-canonical NTP hydrolase)
MDSRLLDYIRTLTKTDKKSLSQKALKLTEEVGELAKVVLPFENAFATTHRFVDRSKILEELADCQLVLSSILYDLDFSNEEFEQMVGHKMKYWADLQAREGRMKYPVPYEIHVTVNVGSRIDLFKDACAEAKVKPILLDLHLRDGSSIQDLMTSSVFMGNNREAFEEMRRISSFLSERGFEVLREKIETIPWHPAAPSRTHQNAHMPPNCYFECHFNVLCTEAKEADLDAIAKRHSAHKSRNAWKRYADGTYTIMVTYRDYKMMYEDFRAAVDALKQTLTSACFQVEKEIVEFSVYDTKVSHDAAWLLSGGERAQV